LRVLLDTSYLLPAIGISIKGIPNDAIERLLDRGNEAFISEISLFELSAKGARYVVEGQLPPERVTGGINAISNDDSITKLPGYDAPTLRLAFGLRRIHGDFIDCLIVSSAANHCGVLVTEDEEIHRLKEEKGFDEIMAAAGSACKIRRMGEVLRE
jgi:PIN domain nuclease of toxin-antitoxin system